jgi:peroxiredoxin
MEIARERAADGVVLWTVDLREKPKIVKAFIEKSKWDLNVLLDPQGDVASKYGVRGIPHTVLIGPDGNVLLVEVGFMGEEHSMKLFNDAINTVLAAAGN